MFSSSYRNMRHTHEAYAITSKIFSETCNSVQSKINEHKKGLGQYFVSCPKCKSLCLLSSQASSGVCVLKWTHSTPNSLKLNDIFFLCTCSLSERCSSLISICIFMKCAHHTDTIFCISCLHLFEYSCREVDGYQIRFGDREQKDVNCWLCTAQFNRRLMVSAISFTLCRWFCSCHDCSCS